MSLMYANTGNSDILYKYMNLLQLYLNIIEYNSQRKHSTYFCKCFFPTVKKKLHFSEQQQCSGSIFTPWKCTAVWKHEVSKEQKRRTWKTKVSNREIRLWIYTKSCTDDSQPLQFSFTYIEGNLLTLPLVMQGANSSVPQDAHKFFIQKCHLQCKQDNVCCFISRNLH